MNNVISMINPILKLLAQLKQRDPNEVYRSMYQNNPQFRQFVDNNKGKSPKQIATDYGIDIDTIKALLR